MNHEPKDSVILSVVTVTRNAAPLLRRTIASVAAQKSSNLEYIVVDGASTDNSVGIIKESPVVGKYVSEPDKGIYDAMNKGARMASGEWILFMNAGDTFASPDVAERLMEEATKFPSSDVVYGDVIRASEENKEGIVKRASDNLKGHRLAFCHQSVMCRRELLLRHPFDISHKYSADFKFFKTIQKNGLKFRHVSFPVARFDTSGISTRNRSKGLADNMKVVAEVDGVFRGFLSILHLVPTYLICRLKGK